MSPEVAGAVLCQFGEYFRKLTLDCYLNKESQIVNDLLKDLTSHGRLESLTLSVSVSLRKLEARVPQHEVNLDAISYLISSSSSLRSFSLLSWPDCKRFITIDALDVLNRNCRISESLKQLNIFSPKNKDWYPFARSLPSHNQILQTLNKFPFLKQLSLYFSLVTSEVVRTLSHSNLHCLEKFHLTVQFSRQQGLNEIGVSDWLKLKNTCPELKVEFSFVNIVPYEHLNSLLKREIPVSLLCFGKYSYCTKGIMEAQTDRYSSTLKTFINSSNGVDRIDRALLNLVYQCTNLENFIYHGTIQHTTVVELAQCRQSKWRRFQVKEDSIRTGQPLGSEFDDLVIVKDVEGENYNFVRNLRELSETDDCRELHLKQLAETVSLILRREWLPFK